jgi:hypothetical protein
MSAAFFMVYEDGLQLERSGIASAHDWHGRTVGWHGLDPSAMKHWHCCRSDWVCFKCSEVNKKHNEFCYKCKSLKRLSDACAPPPAALCWPMLPNATYRTPRFGAQYDLLCCAAEPGSVVAEAGERDETQLGRILLARVLRCAQRATEWIFMSSMFGVDGGTILKRIGKPELPDWYLSCKCQ